MPSETRHLKLTLLDGSDLWSTEAYNANWQKVDELANPNSVSTNVIPDDINGLSSSEIDDLFQQDPRNGTIKLALDDTDVVIIARVGGEWFKATLTPVDA